MTSTQPPFPHVAPRGAFGGAPPRSRPTLLGAPYSPWTERARWALDHHGIDYHFEEHIPVVGELALRRRLRGHRGPRATVPVFFDERDVLPDSLGILLHADTVGRGPRLVTDRDETTRYFARIEQGLLALRGRVLASMQANPEAQRESAEVLSKRFAGFLRPAVRLSSRFMASKYGVGGMGLEDCERRIRPMLFEIRRDVDRGLLSIDAFTAHHLAAATFLQGIAPVRAAHIPLSPAVRQVWTCEPLAQEFPDLLAWRDAIYARRRGAVGG